MSDIDRAIGAIDALPDAFRAATQEAAERLHGVSQAQYATGQGPDGSTWPALKEGAGVPLRELTTAIITNAAGDRIVMAGPDEVQFHRHRRPVFPEGGSLPAAWDEAIGGAMREAFDRTVAT